MRNVRTERDLINDIEKRDQIIEELQEDLIDAHDEINDLCHLGETDIPSLVEQAFFSGFDAGREGKNCLRNFLNYKIEEGLD